MVRNSSEGGNQNLRILLVQALKRQLITEKNPRLRIEVVLGLVSSMGKCHSNKISNATSLTGGLA